MEQLLTVVFSLLFLDQLTKVLAAHYLSYGKPVAVIGSFFQFTYIKNPGVLFGMNFGSPILYIALSVFAVIFLLFIYFSEEKYLPKLAISLIIAGALGNLIDRIRLGAVIDFLDFDFPDFIMQRWPIFNFADVFIFIGIFLFLGLSIWAPKKDETVIGV